LGFFCRPVAIAIVASALIAVQIPSLCAAWEGSPQANAYAYPVSWQLAPALGLTCGDPRSCSLPPGPMCVPYQDLLLKVAYGRTFGTSTQLDYATLEMSKSVRKFPAMTIWGPAVGEVQVALMASYVIYTEGTIERLKSLDFHDGYELAWVPKGRFSFPNCQSGMVPYLESGAGLSYVSETYRNSGSRWNWSLMAGFGVERILPGHSVLSIGVQWRHLSNGNMWGTGDELHNSNSGTDMIQGLASVLHRF
jgi:Lipid A 3-O-deacylase (PagL)